MNFTTLTKKELFQAVAKARGWIETPEVIYFDKAVAVELFNQYGLDARKHGDLWYVTMAKGSRIKTEESKEFETAVFCAFVSVSDNVEIIVKVSA